MFKLIVWIIIFAGIYFAYQAGLFNGIINYFNESAMQARQEKVIEHEDGSYTTVRYRNVFDLLLGRK